MFFQRPQEGCIPVPVPEMRTEVSTPREGAPDLTPSSSQVPAPSTGLEKPEEDAAREKGHHRVRGCSAVVQGCRERRESEESSRHPPQRNTHTHTHAVRAAGRSRGGSDAITALGYKSDLGAAGEKHVFTFCSGGHSISGARGVEMQVETLVRRRPMEGATIRDARVPSQACARRLVSPCSTRPCWAATTLAPRTW